MNKILIILFLFISLVSNALADIINDIEVKGNLRLSKQSIIIFSGLNINQDYNSDDLNIDNQYKPPHHLLDSCAVNVSFSLD